MRLTAGCAAMKTAFSPAADLRLVVVQVAVAEVPESDDADIGKSLRELAAGALDELRNARNRYRDVVLDTQALALLRFADILAQGPQTLRLLAALRDDRVADRAAFQGFAKKSLERLPSRRSSLAT
jgi:hypothetical protein